jgi:eukaryotic-like serine/threonine-protein kinase
MTPATTTVRIVGRYALYGVLASGGMATVHFGRLIGPVGFSRTVAIKRLHPQFAADPEFVAMFLDEARLAARIRHPNVIPTLDVVATSGELFLVMEYVPGESMARLVRAMRGRGFIIPPNVTVAIMVGVLQGLHAAHEARNEQGAPLGIVHRDVSPQNVLVGADGQARVLDFGVAKAAGRVQTTREGQLKGKLAYMAPEQLRGETCSRQTDIYAAAVVLWEALAGDRLFKADNEGAVISKVLEGRVAPPSHTMTPNMDGPTRLMVGRLDAIVMRAISREPADRFATAREMALALEKAIPPATASQVSEWVESIASDVLLTRAAQIAEIESSSATIQPQTTVPTPAPPTAELSSGVDSSSGASAVAGRASDGHSGAGMSSVSVAANNPPTESPSPVRRRALVVALGIAVLVLAPLAAVTILRANAERRDGAPAVPGDGIASATPFTEPSSAPAAASVDAVPDAAPTEAPSSPSSASHAAHAPPSPPDVRGPRKTAPAHPSGCNPPFTYDAAGMKHYKPECL